MEDEVWFLAEMDLLLLLLMCFSRIQLLCIIDHVDPVKPECILQNPYPCPDSIDNGHLHNRNYFGV